MTFSFLLLTFAVALLCGLVIVMTYLPRPGLPHCRATLRLIAFLLFASTAFWSAYGLIEAYCNHQAPTRDTVLATLHACTANPDRAAVLAALKNTPKMPYWSVDLREPATFSFVEFPPHIASQAASSIFVLAAPVQNENPRRIFRRQIMAVFLFDSHQRLLTWSYAIRNPHD